MRRRAYLGTVVSAAGLLGGCLSGAEDDGTPTGTAPDGTGTRTANASGTPTTTETAVETQTETDIETRTETETETETPTGPPLEIEQANLVWSDQGETPVEENRVESASPGSLARLGVVVRPRLDDGEAFLPRVDVETLTDDGEPVDTFSDTFDRMDEAPEPTDWYTLGVNTTGYARGTYTASVTVTELIRDVTTEAERFEFDLVEPLAADEVELVEYGPETVEAGEEFTLALTFENQADRSSNVHGRLTIGLDEGDALADAGETAWTVPAESTVTHRYDEMVVDEPGTYRWELDPYDFSWEIAVEE